MDTLENPQPAEEKVPWYFRKFFIILAVCTVGPLALPLIWFRPRTALTWKIALTVGIIILSWILYESTMESIRTLEEVYKMMMEMN